MNERADRVIKIVISKSDLNIERAITTIAGVKNRSGRTFGIGPTTMSGTMGGVKPKPASKPADPAFKNALRQRPMRIGLRYIGD